MNEFTKTPIDHFESRDSSNPLLIAVDLIKQAREAKRLSIDELAESIRIGKEQLEALENGRMDLLPEEVFIRAMILRLGEKLKIEKSILLNALNSKEKISSKDYPKQQISTKDFNLKSPNLITLLTIAITITSITASVFAINYINSSSKPQDNPLKSLAN